MLFDPIRDRRRIDEQTEFYISFLGRLREICRRHQGFSPIDYNAFCMQRTVHRTGRSQRSWIIVQLRQACA